jgi:prepilin-type N-terminal cleavage/methylation domain-containing protein
MKLKNSTSGFTLVELIIGMTIFSIGLTGIYALLNTTIANVNYSRDEIVVAGLLREQIDLAVNMRDSNLRNYIPWDSVVIESPWTQTLMESGVYLIENNFSTPTITLDTANWNIISSPIKLTRISNLPTTDEAKWNLTQLHTDTKWRYIHSQTIGTTTKYASYIIVSPLSVNGVDVKKNGHQQWWILDARVMVNLHWWYREYDAKSMITDWQK